MASDANRRFTAAWRGSLYVRVLCAGLGTAEYPARLAIVGVCPWVLFWAWFFGADVRSHVDGRLSAAIIAASLWMLIAPLLMALSERHLRSVLSTLCDAPHRDGWAIEPMLSALLRSNRYYWPVSIVAVLVFGCGFLAANSLMVDQLGLPKLALMLRITGTICMAATGLATGAGIWGVIKVVMFFKAIRVHSKPAWYPLRPYQIDGYESLSQFALLTAAGFSCGALFAPIVWIALLESDGIVRLLCAFGLTGLALGSVILFTIPTRYLALLAREARDRQLDRLAQFTEQRLATEGLAELCEDVDSEVELAEVSLAVLLMLRPIVAQESATSRLLTLGARAGLLVLLPAVIGIVPPVLAELLVA